VGLSIAEGGLHTCKGYLSNDAETGNEGESLRKFTCGEKGNPEISAWYCLLERPQRGIKLTSIRGKELGKPSERG